jgi:hypothetical protein
MASFSRLSNGLKHVMIAVLLLAFSFAGNAQENQTPQGTGGTSHSEQSQDYRRNIEKPSGYDVPRGGLATQPWVWALAAAGLVLLIGLIYKSKTDPELRD